MKQHEWVEMQMTPIQAVKFEDSIITSSTEDEEYQAAQDSIEICFACHISLSPDTIDTECPGVEGRKEV